MKVAINRCFGGFGISNEAFEKLLDRKGIAFDKVEAEEGRAFVGATYYEAGHSGEDNYYLSDYDMTQNRDDADLIAVIEEMGAQVEELTNKLNEEIERNVILNKMLSESQQVEVFNQMTEGLTATQADKLKTLAEGITYDSVEEYAEKVSTLKESYFPTSAVKAARELDLIEPGTEGKTMIAEELNGSMAKYVKALGKSLPK